MCVYISIPVDAFFFFNFNLLFLSPDSRASMKPSLAQWYFQRFCFQCFKFAFYLIFVFCSLKNMNYEEHLSFTGSSIKSLPLCFLCKTKSIEIPLAILCSLHRSQNVMDRHFYGHFACSFKFNAVILIYLEEPSEMHFSNCSLSIHFIMYMIILWVFVFGSR